MDSENQPQGFFFCKPVALSVGAGKNSEKSIQLVTIHIKNQTNSGGRKYLDLQLTMEDDPLFLFCLQVDEEDFHTLKAEQTLLVDFVQFPSKVVELLQSCIHQQREAHPKFIAQLLQNDVNANWTFSIIETNTFKHINHISLKFTPGNDFTTKTHLANVVKDLKEERARTNTNLQGTKFDLDKVSANLISAYKQIEEFKLAFQLEKSGLTMDAAKVLLDEREKWTKTVEDNRKLNEMEEKTLKREYDEKTRSLSEQLTKLQAVHSEKVRSASSVEKNMLAAQSRLDHLLGDHATVKQDRERISTTKTHLEESLANLNVKYDSLASRQRETERGERGAGENLIKLQDKLEVVNNQLKREQEAVSNSKIQYEKLELDIKGAGEEILKANDIIRKLQGDLKNAKTKSKLKNVVTLQQEKLLDERSSSIDLLQKENHSVKDQLQKSSVEIEQSHAKITVFIKTIEENKKVIEDNNHVIDWLHKQLNEDALQRPSKLPFSPIDFNKYSGSENKTPVDSKYSTDLMKKLGDSRIRYTSVESAGAFERASPVPQIPLGISRGPSVFSSHTDPARTKSPINAAYHHFNTGSVNNRSFKPSASTIPHAPKSNYF